MCDFNTFQGKYNGGILDGNFKCKTIENSYYTIIFEVIPSEFYIGYGMWFWLWNKSAMHYVIQWFGLATDRWHSIVQTNDTLVHRHQCLITRNDYEKSLLWRHNQRDSVSNHQRFHCLLNRLFRRRSKKTPKLRVTGLCAGNSPVTGEFPHKGPVTQKMFPFDDVIIDCWRPEDDWGWVDMVTYEL